MSTLDLQRGAVVAGKYRIEHELGSGGMGRVLAATHVDLGSRVALKVLTVEGRHAGDAVARFLREARAAARLRSEFVARVSDFGTLDGERPFMVLEYLEGHDLGVLMARGLPRGELVDAICQACAGLAEAHAVGIVHRDLKPSNLFRTRRPDGSHCTKVLDFGISKLLGSTPEAALVSTKTSAILGTPLYMSPEQVRSTRDVEPRTDVWSLGVVLAEGLLGRPPFGGDSLGEVFARILEHHPSFDELPDLPVGLGEVVARCLEKRAEDRWADVAALAAALAPFASDEGRDAARRAGATVREAAKPSELPVAPPIDLVDAATVAVEAEGPAPVRTVAARSVDERGSRLSTPSVEPNLIPLPTAVTVDGEHAPAPQRGALGRRWAIGIAVAAVVAASVGLWSRTREPRHADEGLVRTEAPPPNASSPPSVVPQGALSILPPTPEPPPEASAEPLPPPTGEPAPSAAPRASTPPRATSSPASPPPSAPSSQRVPPATGSATKPSRPTLD